MSTCPCGRNPDPGMCEPTCSRVSGAHCNCMHDDTVIRESAVVIAKQLMESDWLAAHDREVAAQALEDAAEDVHLGDSMTQLNRHGNSSVIRNAESEAASWLNHRAAKIRETHGQHPTRGGVRMSSPSSPYAHDSGSER